MQQGYRTPLALALLGFGVLLAYGLAISTFGLGLRWSLQHAPLLLGVWLPLGLPASLLLGSVLTTPLSFLGARLLLTRGAAAGGGPLLH